MAIATSAKCDGRTFECGAITPIGEQQKVSVRSARRVER